MVNEYKAVGKPAAITDGQPIGLIPLHGLSFTRSLHICVFFRKLYAVHNRITVFDGYTISKGHNDGGLGAYKCIFTSGVASV